MAQKYEKSVLLMIFLSRSLSWHFLDIPNRHFHVVVEKREETNRMYRKG
jgi:hypothetical protein